MRTSFRRSIARLASETPIIPASEAWSWTKRLLLEAIGRSKARAAQVSCRRRIRTDRRTCGDAPNWDRDHDVVGGDHGRDLAWGSFVGVFRTARAARTGECP